MFGCLGVWVFGCLGIWIKNKDLLYGLYFWDCVCCGYGGGMGL